MQLRNPHAILAALEARPRSVKAVRTPPGGGGEAWKKLAGAARAAGIPVEAAASGSDRHDAARRGGAAKEGRVGGGEADVEPRAPVPLAEFFAKPCEATGYGVWLALDQIQDPHNVGSIFRSAAFFGARGVLLTSDRAAPVAAVVHDTAAGGVEHMRFAIETNLSQALSQAKEADLWVLGSSESDPRGQDLERVPLDRDWLLVVGNEESGLRRLTLESCDDICRIPARGALGSLNAAVATAVMLNHLTTGKTTGQNLPPEA